MHYKPRPTDGLLCVGGKLRDMQKLLDLPLRLCVIAGIAAQHDFPAGQFRDIGIDCMPDSSTGLEEIRIILLIEYIFQPLVYQNTGFTGYDKLCSEIGR